MNTQMERLISAYGIGVDLPWILVLCLLPLVIIALFRVSNNNPNNNAAADADNRSSNAIRAAHYQHFTYKNEERSLHEAGDFALLTKVLLWLAWLLFVVSLSRPFFLGEAIQQPLPTRDIMLAVDLSESMANNDMQIDGRYQSRLDIAKRVLNDFIDTRSNDRLGLIYFADTAYLASPLTTDKETLSFLLDQGEVGLIGDATSITDAVGLTTRLFTDYQGEQPVLIVLTDGDNTSGNIDKSDTVDLALSANIQIFSIVFGLGYDDGNNEIDFSFLEAITQSSNGELYFAKDAQALAQVYEQLNEQALNPSAMTTFSPKYYIHFYSMLACLMLLSFLLLPRLLPRLSPPLSDKKSNEELERVS